MSDRCPVSCIVPPHILLRLLEGKDQKLRELALSTLLSSTQIRARRGVLGVLAIGTPAGAKRRTIYDAQHQEIRSGILARAEGDAAAKDPTVNEAYEGIGITYDFYDEILDRNSLDGNGMRLDAIVHYGDRFNNAFWDGERMLFGDGDEVLFTSFTRSLDVIAHELTHGVTEFTAGLEYHKQPGALNESMSDVFGSLVKQWHLGQDVHSADWKIGGDIFTPERAGDALRSLANPGSAYDNPLIGRDPQPKHMSDFQNLPDTFNGDWGGVHINSGIPNHAFYRVAVALGGNAWNAAGHIWYETLAKNLGPRAQFQDFADTTFDVAGRLYGPQEQDAVRDGWRGVGIRVAQNVARSDRSAYVRPQNGRGADGTDSLEALHRKINALTQRIDRLASLSQ